MAAALHQRIGVDPMQGWSLALSAGAAAAGWALVEPLFAASVGLGALLEAANFRQLRRHCQAIVFGGGGGGLAAAGFGLRFALLGGAVGVALYAGAHPVGLVLGLSMIVPAAIGVAFWGRPAPSEAAPLEPLPPDDPSWERWSVWLAGEREPEAEDEDEEPGLGVWRA